MGLVVVNASSRLAVSPFSILLNDFAIQRFPNLYVVIINFYGSGDVFNGKKRKWIKRGSV